MRKRTRDIASNFRTNVKPKTEVPPSAPMEHICELSPTSPLSTSSYSSLEEEDELSAMSMSQSFESEESESIVLLDDVAVQCFERNRHAYKKLPLSTEGRNALARIFLSRVQPQDGKDSTWKQVWTQLQPAGDNFNQFINLDALSNVLQLLDMDEDALNAISTELNNFADNVALHKEESLYSKAARLTLNLAMIDNDKCAVQQHFAVVVGGLFLHYYDIPFDYRMYLPMIQEEGFQNCVHIDCEESMSNLFLGYLNRHWQSLFDFHLHNADRHCLICFANGYNINTSCCRKPFHLDCLSHWCGNNSESMHKETCPHCRSTINLQVAAVAPISDEALPLPPHPLQLQSPTGIFFTPPTMERELASSISPFSIAFSHSPVYSIAVPVPMPVMYPYYISQPLVAMPTPFWPPNCPSFPPYNFPPPPF